MLILFLGFTSAVYIYLGSVSKYMWVGNASEPHGGPIYSASEINITVSKDSPVDMVFRDKKTDAIFCIDDKRDVMVTGKHCGKSNNLFRIVRDITGKFRIMQNESCLQYVSSASLYYMRKCTSSQEQLFELLNERGKDYPKTMEDVVNNFITGQ